MHFCSISFRFENSNDFISCRVKKLFIFAARTQTFKSFNRKWWQWKCQRQHHSRIDWFFFGLISIASRHAKFEEKHDWLLCSDPHDVVVSSLVTFCQADGDHMEIVSLVVGQTKLHRRLVDALHLYLPQSAKITVNNDAAGNRTDTFSSIICSKSTEKRKPKEIELKRVKLLRRWVGGCRWNKCRRLCALSSLMS